MSKSRKIYVLQHDRTVQSAKKPIRALIASGVIDDLTEWVLIPIRDSSSTYIAVSGATILQDQFATVDIRYHMKLKMMNGVPKDEGVTEEILKDYYTTTITAQSPEDLYNAIHNLLFFYYVREQIAGSDLLDYYWFMEISDVEFVLRDGNGKKMRRVIIESKDYDDDCPFDYPTSFNFDKGEMMLNKIAAEFGLIYPDSMIRAPNLYFKVDHDRLIWGQYQTKIDLYSTISRILCVNPYTKSMVMLKMKEMDVLLKVHSASMFIQPIDLYDFKDDGLYDRLPVAHDFGLPKYILASIDDLSNGDEQPGYAVTEHYGPMVIELFSYEFYDPEDFAYALDNIGLWMQIYHEGASSYAHLIRHGGMHDFDPNDSDQHRITTTVFVTFVAQINDIRGTPAEDQLLVYTDSYEDEKPNIKEVCAILAAQEKII